jgi:hypothetical protein
MYLQRCCSQLAPPFRSNSNLKRSVAILYLLIKFGVLFMLGSLVSGLLAFRFDFYIHISFIFLSFLSPLLFYFFTFLTICFLRLFFCHLSFSIYYILFFPFLYTKCYYLIRIMY